MTKPTHVVLVGATGNAGHRIATQLAARSVPLTLTGRDRTRLEDLAERIGAADIAVADLNSLSGTVDPTAVIVNAAGPFTDTSTPLIDTALRHGGIYIDIANELPALQQLLQRGDQARQCGATLITGAGFGPTVTEAMLADLRAGSAAAIIRVGVISAPSADAASPGVQATVAATMARGTAWFADGVIQHAPFGAGSTAVELDGGTWNVTPAPTGDLLAAQRLTQAPEVTAYFAAPGNRNETDMRSRAYVELAFDDRSQVGRMAVLGPGADVSAAITAETVARVLRAEQCDVIGVWTPVSLFGPTVLTDATHVDIIAVDPTTVWALPETMAR